MCPRRVRTAGGRGAQSPRDGVPPTGRFSRVAVPPCAAICDFCYRQGKGLKDWLERRHGYNVTNSSITNSEERTQRNLRERTLAIVKRQKVLSDKVLALHPKCKGCKRALLSRGPLRPASTFSWAYAFRSSHGSTQKLFVRHWLPWTLTFQGDGPPSVPERAPECLCRGQGPPQVWGVAAKEAGKLGGLQESPGHNAQSSAWTQEHPELPCPRWGVGLPGWIPLDILVGKIQLQPHSHGEHVPCGLESTGSHFSSIGSSTVADTPNHLHKSLWRGKGFTQGPKKSLLLIDRGGIQRIISLLWQKRHVSH